MLGSIPFTPHSHQSGQVAIWIEQHFLQGYGKQGLAGGNWPIVFLCKALSELLSKTFIF